MPPVKPIKRQELIRYLSLLGYEGPYAGGNHQYMVRDKVRLTIPNPHPGEIGSAFLLRILRQAGITRADWERL